MGYEIRRWLRVELGPKVVGLPRLVALEIADDANEITRLSYADLADLAAWTAAKDTKAVKDALLRLAAQGWEFRRAIGKGADGRPLYAVPGRKLTFWVPEGPKSVGPLKGQGPNLVGPKGPNPVTEGPNPVTEGPNPVTEGPNPVGPISSAISSAIPSKSSAADRQSAKGLDPHLTDRPVGVAAAELVESHPADPGRWTEHERHELRRQAAALLGSGIPELHVAEGLRRLAGRPDGGVGLLRNLTHDAVRGKPARRPRRERTFDPNATVSYHHQPGEEARCEVLDIEDWRQGG
ncbi:hypothetical protein [Pseudofrankia inefficax]|uniref:Helix-turn-helix domain-containing protein n=1 Tax=Pseudofrankia inefficax (strain DSM 45817 / CECT 9037 / DDB 130130 / EuI1c) TaxID=298654 RepID=E3J647_PSEI1|nr:hypothetical protein [Pseudofrankia inefficax]ADP78338.1 hypothetical protein FraEuI1c_0252 [Pseudofrankia inefficax]